MAKSHKPIVWGLFAGGGTLTAFITPVLIFITGLAIPLGAWGPDLLAYDRVLAFAQNWIGKLILFGVIFLSLWHAAHRFRITIHDFGIRADMVVAVVSYALAAVGTVVTLVALLRV